MSDEVPTPHLLLKTKDESVTTPNQQSRKPYPQETRQRVLDAYENGDDWKAVAVSLGVHSHTANRWIYEKEHNRVRGKHGGHKPKLLSDEDVDKLTEWAGEDPSCSLEILRTRLKTECGKEVSRSTISTYLDGKLIAFKKLHPTVEVLSTELHKDQRKLYVLDVLSHTASGAFTIWVDEVNFKLFCNRTHGRSGEGQEARAIVANSRGINIHIMCAISERGMLSYSIERGLCSEATFQCWMRKMLDTLSDQERRNSVIVCDNSPCHVKLECLLEEPQYAGGTLLRLAPNSPDLNPFEGVWTMVTYRMKQLLRECNDVMFSGDPSAVLSQRQWRLKCMEASAREAISGISVSCFQYMIRDVQSVYQKVLKNENL